MTDNRVEEIAKLIASGELSIHQVFTQMHQLIKRERNFSEEFIYKAQANAINSFSVRLFEECAEGSQEDSDKYRKSYTDFYINHVLAKATGDAE